MYSIHVGGGASFSANNVKGKYVAYQKVFIVLAIVIGGGYTLFISEPGQHLLHVLQVLMNLMD